MTPIEEIKNHIEARIFAHKITADQSMVSLKGEIKDMLHVPAFAVQTIHRVDKARDLIEELTELLDYVKTKG